MKSDDWIDAKFNDVFDATHENEREARRETPIMAVIGGVLGYLLLGTIAATFSGALLFWCLRAIPNNVNSHSLKRELADLCITFPEKAELAAQREKIRRKVGT